MQQYLAAFRILGLTLASAALVACGGGGGGGESGPTTAQKAAVVANYADIAAASYADARSDAVALQTAITAFLATPSVATQDAAKAAYKQARESYQQTEGYRFDESFIETDPASDGGLESVDAWEGEVNSWPLDEALIDYVAPGTGGRPADPADPSTVPANGKNVINSTSITVNGVTVDTTTINKTLLASLNQIGGSEANVATGYHAIEFLLWGQDLSQAQGVAGQRPFTDYATGGACTNGTCLRRRAYLAAAVDLLVDDLTAMAAEWNPATAGKTLRTDLLAVNVDKALNRVFYGMGSLALGELASERILVADLTDSPEDEHDCFSDTSANSYLFDGQGIANIYRGSFERRDGSVVSGASLADLIESASMLDADATAASLTTALANLQALQASASTGKTFDYLIDGNDDNDLIGSVVDSLQAFTEDLEGGAQALGISVTSDCGSQLCGD